jgi:hypothetical protein
MMKFVFILTGLVFIIGYNAVLAKRDYRMFESYDRVCAELPKPHPDCRYDVPVQ